MGFELYVPRTAMRGPELPAGRMRITKNGHGVLNATDLVAINVTGPLLVPLIDKSNGRLGLRAPRDGEVFGLRAPGTTKKGTPKARREFGLGGVLKSMGLDPAKIHGDYDVICKDELLIVHLAEVPAKKKR